MTPVDQTILGYGGDCWRACVASLVELAVADVPHFMGDAHRSGGNWPEALATTRNWLSSRGFALRPLRASFDGSTNASGYTIGNLTYCTPGFPAVRERYAIFAVETGAMCPNGTTPLLHAVIGYVSLFPWSDPWVAHDPSPELRGRRYERVVDAFAIEVDAHRYEVR